MMADEEIAPEVTAMRVARWRALHLQLDPPPHLIKDTVGLRLIGPRRGWNRMPGGGMQPGTLSRIRASIVARARFIEDMLAGVVQQGVGQYVILGAGLDSFAQRRPKLASRLTIYEIDQPGPQAWKRQRLIERGFGIPDQLRFVPVNFEKGDSWPERLAAAGFDPARPTMVASAGVSMYLSRESNAAVLHDVAAFAPGSTLVMTFNLPLELIDPEERPIRLAMANDSELFRTFFTPPEMLALAREAGFTKVAHVPATRLAELYFAGRSDGLRPSSIEDLIVART